jgi:uncharacterized membrane protein YraQ (UPF0718 family)
MDFLLEPSFLITMGIIVAGIIVVIVIGSWISRYNKREFEKEIKQIRSLGYSDIDDVSVFLDLIGGCREDFIKSKSLRRQYALFVEGKSSEFLDNAKNASRLKEAEDENTTNLVTGMVLGTMVGSSMK